MPNGPKMSEEPKGPEVDKEEIRKSDKYLEYTRVYHDGSDQTLMAKLYKAKDAGDKTAVFWVEDFEDDNLPTQDSLPEQDHLEIKEKEYSELSEKFTGGNISKKETKKMIELMEEIGGDEEVIDWINNDRVVEYLEELGFSDTELEDLVEKYDKDEEDTEAEQVETKPVEPLFKGKTRRVNNKDVYVLEPIDNAEKEKFSFDFDIKDLSREKKQEIVQKLSQEKEVLDVQQVNFKSVKGYKGGYNVVVEVINENGTRTEETFWASQKGNAKDKYKRHKMEQVLIDSIDQVAQEEKNVNKKIGIYEDAIAFCGLYDKKLLKSVIKALFEAGRSPRHIENIFFKEAQRGKKLIIRDQFRRFEDVINNEIDAGIDNKKVQNLENRLKNARNDEERERIYLSILKGNNFNEDIILKAIRFLGPAHTQVIFFNNKGEVRKKFSEFEKAIRERVYAFLDIEKIQSIEDAKKVLEKEKNNDKKLIIYEAVIDKNLFDTEILSGAMHLIFIKRGLRSAQDKFLERDKKGNLKEKEEYKGSLIGWRRLEAMNKDFLYHVKRYLKEDAEDKKQSLADFIKYNPKAEVLKEEAVRNTDKAYENYPYILQTVESLYRMAREPHDEVFLESLIKNLGDEKKMPYILYKPEKEKLAKLLEKYWSEIAVHGSKVVEFNEESEEYEEKINEFSDLDGKSAIFLLEQAGIKPKVHYVAPGGEEEGILNIDTGMKTGFVGYVPTKEEMAEASSGEKFLKTEKARTAWMDHHGPASTSDTSATEVLYNTLMALGMLDRTKEREYRGFVKFVNTIDNQTHKAYKNWDQYKESYHTLLGLGKRIRPEEVFKYMGVIMYNKGWEEEVSDEDFIRLMGEETMRHRNLREVSRKQKKTIEAAEEKIEELDEKGFNIETEYGKITIDLSGPMIGEAVRAKKEGKGGYLKWNPLKNNFFFNIFDEDSKIEEGLFYDEEDQVSERGLRIRDKMWVKSQSIEPIGLSLKSFLEKLGANESQYGEDLSDYIEKEDKIFKETEIGESDLYHEGYEIALFSLEAEIEEIKSEKERKVLKSAKEQMLRHKKNLEKDLKEYKEIELKKIDKKSPNVRTQIRELRKNVKEKQAKINQITSEDSLWFEKIIDNKLAEEDNTINDLMQNIDSKAHDRAKKEAVKKRRELLEGLMEDFEEKF